MSIVQMINFNIQNINYKDFHYTLLCNDIFKSSSEKWLFIFVFNDIYDYNQYNYTKKTQNQNADLLDLLNKIPVSILFLVIGLHTSIFMICEII